MAKLYFRYGVISSAKTLNLLATLHNYEQQGKRALLLKPALDTRSVLVESRAGMSHKADYVLSYEDRITPLIENEDSLSAILVDEVQFFSPDQIKELRLISALKEIPVLTYGLRTKFDGSLWESVISLMALADSIEEIKTTCAYCSRKAVFSKRVSSSKSDVELSWDKYVPVCPYHFYKEANESRL